MPDSVTLMSTHLYEMDKIGKPCVFVIGPTGFTARPVGDRDMT
ncbi:hypothetical protein [Nocardia niwae]|uniref:Uncharacterized protein n=1 Tax=Nocardia niwae TaxID=626084 RepID=A0ABV2X9X2_9NOCA